MNRHLWALGGKQEEAEGTQSMSVYDGIPSRGKPVTKDGAPKMADGVGGSRAQQRRHHAQVW